MSVREYFYDNLRSYIRLCNRKEAKFHKVSSKDDVSVGDVRVFHCIPPVYVVVVGSLGFERGKVLYKCLVATEEVELGYLGDSRALVKLDKEKTLLIVLPFWVYLLEEVLEDYTMKVDVVSDECVKDLMDYAEKKILPDRNDVRGVYISLVAKRLKELNSVSLLEFFDSLEEEG